MEPLFDEARRVVEERTRVVIEKRSLQAGDFWKENRIKYYFISQEEVHFSKEEIKKKDNIRIQY